MPRIIIALALGTTILSALPAFAGPSGSSVPSYFPLNPWQPGVAREEPPHALLGDVDQSYYVGTRPVGVPGTLPSTGWQRRPSEAK
jgi:hypothetical protein